LHLPGLFAQCDAHNPPLQLSHNWSSSWIQITNCYKWIAKM
jgi:hypothetical protein